MTIEPSIGQPFKSGDVEGRIVFIHVGHEFKVRTKAGEEVTFPYETENDHDKCEICGKVDPKHHRWHFARSLRADQVSSENIYRAIEAIGSQAREHIRKYSVDGEVMFEGRPVEKDGFVTIRASVTPKVLCARTETRP
jgi:hypothetical protein